MKIIAAIPETFWIDRLNVSGKMANIEGENAGIAGVASRGFLMRGCFPPRIWSNPPAENAGLVGSSVLG